MPGSVIVGSARTPIGKLSGALAGFSATDLGGLAIKAALERAGVDAEQVDYVLMGQVLLGGQGQITARQAAVKAGIPMTVPATTVNKVCLSGINAIYLADQMIAAGDAEVVVAGGMESMTNAPVPAPGRACRLPHGQRRARRLADQRRALVRLRRRAHGRRHREVRRPGRRHHARRAGRARGEEPRARGGRAEGRTLRRRDHAGLDPAAQGRPGRRSTPTKASVRAPPPSRSGACARRSPRTARSPPATRRRSPTAARP